MGINWLHVFALRLFAIYTCTICGYQELLYLYFIYIYFIFALHLYAIYTCTICGYQELVYLGYLDNVYYFPRKST